MENKSRVKLLNRIVFLVASVIAIAYAGSKGAGPESIRFLRTDPEIEYLVDTGSGVTSNAVTVAFRSFMLPSTAIVVLSYIPKPSTNVADEVIYKKGELVAWESLIEIGGGKWDFEFENANSNRWFCYTTYTPGATVHTNGVAVMEMMFHPASTNKFIPRNAVIIENGERVYDSSNEATSVTKE